MFTLAKNTAVMLALMIGFPVLSGCSDAMSADSDMAMMTDHLMSRADDGSMSQMKSLYERLGGEAAITAVVDDFVGRAAANPKVNFFRKGTSAEWKPTAADVDHLKKVLVQFVCMATGGPQTYEGRDMKSAHAGMNISKMEFGAIAADLAASLDKFNVPAKEKNELLAIVSTTQKDIVHGHASGDH